MLGSWCIDIIILRNLVKISENTLGWGSRIQEPEIECWEADALINHCIFGAAKRSHYVTYPEEKTSVSRFRRGWSCCDDVLRHEREFHDAKIDHTLNRLKLEQSRTCGVLLCFWSQSTAFNTPEGLNEVSNYRYCGWQASYANHPRVTVVANYLGLLQ